MSFLDTFTKNKTDAELKLYRNQEMLKINEWIFDLRQSHYKEIQQMKLDREVARNEWARENEKQKGKEAEAHFEKKSTFFAEIFELQCKIKALEADKEHWDRLIEERKLMMAFYDAQYNDLMDKTNQNLESKEQEIERLNSVVHKLIEQISIKPDVKMFSGFSDISQVTNV